jgi:hypothetical protein
MAMTASASPCDVQFGGFGSPAQEERCRQNGQTEDNRAWHRVGVDSADPQHNARETDQPHRRDDRPASAVLGGRLSRMHGQTGSSSRVEEE